MKGHDVVLFMKGTPQFPQCGFSGQVVQILDYLQVPYKGINVLESGDLRDGIKTYSQWPTIPQLYVKGEFVGGCDIIREMFQAGELQSLMLEKGPRRSGQGAGVSFAVRTKKRAAPGAALFAFGDTRRDQALASATASCGPNMLRIFSR